jgi:hypothetical protein
MGEADVLKAVLICLTDFNYFCIVSYIDLDTRLYVFH